MKISEAETNEDKFPICDPIPMIKSCEVMENPFDDVVPRNIGKANTLEETPEPQVKPTSMFKKRKFNTRANGQIKDDEKSKGKR